MNTAFATLLVAAAFLSACGNHDAGPQPAAPGLQQRADAVTGHVTAADGDFGGPGLAGARVLFPVGADAKAMTAVIAARLVERGALRWNTRIAEALPELRRMMLPAYRNVTLEDLLAHRAGLPAFTTEDEFRGFLAVLPEAVPAGALPTTDAGRRLFFARWLVRQPPAGENTGFLYSNAGYALATTMMERATGLSYRAMFEQELAHPLGIAGTWREADARGPSSPQAWLDAIMPAGRFATTASTYAGWLRWHLRALQGDSTPLPFGYVERLRGLSPGSYALGWTGALVQGRPVLRHARGAEASLAEAQSDAVIDTDGGSASFALSLAGQGSDSPRASAMLDRLMAGLNSDAPTAKPLFAQLRCRLSRCSFVMRLRRIAWLQALLR
ncbi:serine hydrolase domain-containing protein [Variovorax sp. W6]|uniref:serine hydrolase domain-containing protein n=1 Tax=Variovorax sp. W6 TaxID=3093895 RepID=UPI003D808287